MPPHCPYVQNVFGRMVKDADTTSADLTNLLKLVNDLRIEKSIDGLVPIGLFFFSDQERGGCHASHLVLPMSLNIGPKVAIVMLVVAL